MGGVAVNFVLFAEMDETVDVPEIMESCWAAPHAAASTQG